jgi:hypothetical protein
MTTKHFHIERDGTVFRGWYEITGNARKGTQMVEVFSDYGHDVAKLYSYTPDLLADIILRQLVERWNAARLNDPAEAAVKKFL